MYCARLPGGSKSRTRTIADRLRCARRFSIVDEFQALWDRIKHKTTYRVHFDNEKLIENCVTAIAEGPPITKARVTTRKADLAIGQGGVLATETSSSGPVTIDEGDIVLPDVLTDLQD